MGRKSRKPTQIALAARAFAVFGERDEAARLDRIADRDLRAMALIALARYAVRIDDRGHMPLPDDAPQPPPRARLLDGTSMVPAPRVRLR